MFIFIGGFTRRVDVHKYSYSHILFMFIFIGGFIFTKRVDVHKYSYSHINTHLLLTLAPQQERRYYLQFIKRCAFILHTNQSTFSCLSWDQIKFALRHLKTLLLKRSSNSKMDDQKVPDTLASPLFITLMFHIMTF